MLCLPAKCERKAPVRPATYNEHFLERYVPHQMNWAHFTPRPYSGHFSRESCYLFLQVRCYGEVLTV